MIEDYQIALTMLNRCIANNNKNIPAHSIKTLCLLKLGKYEEVITYFDNVPEDVIIEGEKTGAIALAYAMKKDKAKTLQYQHLLEEQAKASNGFTSDSYLFLMHAVLGEVDKAFQWVEKSLQNKASLLLLRYTDPLVNDLKKDSRYTKYHKVIYPNSDEPQSIGPKKALLDEETTESYKNRLLALFEEEKPYLNSDLSLRSLANHLEIHPNQLSWLLNESIGKNFNEFVNHYRVEAFKKNANDPNNSHLSLIGLAYDSGFNSKTVFNTYFKKETGLTPKQFLKNQN